MGSDGDGDHGPRAPAATVAGPAAAAPPSSAADLQALVVDYLRGIGKRIRDSAGDGYKGYWNVDRYGRPERPVPEKTARDRLLGYLSLRLAPLEVSAEPEARYARGNRADLKIISGLFSVPVEVKRNFHRDIWTAPETQLTAQYLNDPATGGYGVYLVFWFGEPNAAGHPSHLRA